MKKNMGTVDKAIRITIAAIIVVLYYTRTVTGTLGLSLIVLSGIFVLTSFISFCPIYTVFGIKTNKAQKK